jgi:hypothetical protein
MLSLLLKAVPANAKSQPKDIALGVVQPKPHAHKLIVKAKPGMFYRLVDESSGEVWHNQVLLRQGQNLLVMVNQVVVVELVNFFVMPVTDPLTLASMPGYVVSMQEEAGSPLGLVSSNSPVQSHSDPTGVLWQPGLSLPHTLEPQSLGITAVSALSSLSFSTLGLGAATLVAVAANSTNSDTQSNTSASLPTPSISGQLLAGARQANTCKEFTYHADLVT